MEHGIYRFPRERLAALIERLAFPPNPQVLLAYAEEATRRFAAEYAALDAGAWRLPLAAERAAR